MAPRPVDDGRPRQNPSSRNKVGASTPVISSQQDASNFLLDQVSKIKSLYAPLYPEAAPGIEEFAFNSVISPSSPTGKRPGATNSRAEAERKARKRAMDLLQQMQTQGQQQITQGSDTLTQLLQGQQNPYASFQQQTAQVVPELQQLLQAQGASTDPLAQFAAAMQSADTGRQNAFADMMAQLSSIWQASQGQRVADVTAQRNIDLQNLANQAALQRLALGLKG